NDLYANLGVFKVCLRNQCYSLSEWCGLSEKYHPQQVARDCGLVKAGSALTVTRIFVLTGALLSLWSSQRVSQTHAVGTDPSLARMKIAFHLVGLSALVQAIGMALVLPVFNGDSPIAYQMGTHFFGFSTQLLISSFVLEAFAAAVLVATGIFTSFNPAASISDSFLARSFYHRQQRVGPTVMAETLDAFQEKPPQYYIPTFPGAPKQDASSENKDETVVQFPALAH
ncbi:hypothetical protein HK102_005521, partial [Quaeritorhiza haematococci]